MQIRVLGSAAGGGFPQWNCSCNNCEGLRNNTINALARTQSSIAIKADEHKWILLNASPDIRQQLSNYPDMQALNTKRENIFAAILLVDSQIDHTAGLLSLREAGNLNLYCTDPVFYDLNHEFPLVKILSHYGEINRHQIISGTENTFSINHCSHLKFSAIALEGVAPPYSVRRQSPALGDNIALYIEDVGTKKKLFYAPGLAKINNELLNVMSRADCLLIDGTFWVEDEMQKEDVGFKTAQEMGHIPLNGDHGLINILNQFAQPRKILIHINNTNPILREDSDERGVLIDNKVEVAYDGMEINL